MGQSWGRGERDGHGSNSGGERAEACTPWRSGKRISAAGLDGADDRTGAGVAGSSACRAFYCAADSREAAAACGDRGPGFGRGCGADGCLHQIRCREEGAVPKLRAVPHPGRNSGQPAHARLEPARAAPQGARGGRGNSHADRAAGPGAGRRRGLRADGDESRRVPATAGRFEGPRNRHVAHRAQRKLGRGGAGLRSRPAG